MDKLRLEWTSYMQYRAALRGFDLARIEEVVRYSHERYIDNATGRLIAVGRHTDALIMVPDETEEDAIRPVTVHATNRAQIDARVKSGRFGNE
jgi:hypothetical protein